LLPHDERLFMIGSLIQDYTAYEYDYKFYSMQRGVRFSFLEAMFIYFVFFIDLFILFGSVITASFFTLLGIVWICGGL
jgi:hypothetical protein